MHVHPVLIAGGGPAGLTAGLEMVRAGVPVVRNLGLVESAGMTAGYLRARNVLGGHHDLWDVNTERSYYEEQQVARERAG